MFCVLFYITELNKANLFLLIIVELKVIFYKSISIIKTVYD